MTDTKALTLYPFLTIGKSNKTEYIGIIQNQSKLITSIFCYNIIKSMDEKKLFLELGEEYWWSSNRTIPIDVFFRGDFDLFRPYLLAFNTKEFEILDGPTFSIGNLAQKRTKRRTIKLIKKKSET